MPSSARKARLRVVRVAGQLSITVDLRALHSTLDPKSRDDLAAS
jgi:hypothetical protein